jgi:hypothetical protein
MYSSSKFIVKKEKCISEVCKTYGGVRQNDGLSPLLCNLYTNDLPNITDPVSLDVRRLLYADDLILLFIYELQDINIKEYIKNPLTCDF